VAESNIRALPRCAGARLPGADLEPRATEHIPEMVALIEELERKGLAYAAGGDVYYAVDRFPGYGKLRSASSTT